jgi:hypothetical protein
MPYRVDSQHLSVPRQHCLNIMANLGFEITKVSMSKKTGWRLFRSDPETKEDQLLVITTRDLTWLNILRFLKDDCRFDFMPELNEHMEQCFIDSLRKMNLLKM